MENPSVDIENPQELTDYLRATTRISPTEQLQITTLSGGVSNKTVHIRRPSGEEWVLKQALPKLRVQVDWFSDPSRIQREAAGMRALHTLCPPGTITRLIFEDPAQYLLCMEAVPQPHENFKSLLMSGQVDLNLINQFAALLAAIHRHASEAPDSLPQLFDDRSFFESLRLEPYYLYTASQIPAAADFLNGLVTSTRLLRSTLVHGDYSPKNILVHNGRLILLDHEVIHWGDPGFDVGFAMAHLLSKAHYFLDPAYMDAAREFWKMYLTVLGPWNQGPNLEARASQHTLACLLARVAGKSPLEYLTPELRQRQQRVVLAVLRSSPRTMDQVIDRFLMGIELHVPH